MVLEYRVELVGGKVLSVGKGIGVLDSIGLRGRH